MGTLIKRAALEAGLNIGQAARASGISAKMLRYYESIGLIPQASRSASGYRTYGTPEIATLRFIRRARDFGLPMARIKLLVSLWHNETRPSREVKQVALDQVAELDSQIADLTAMRDALADLAGSCRGDDGSDCPILVGLQEDSENQPQPRAVRLGRVRRWDFEPL